MRGRFFRFFGRFRRTEPEPEPTPEPLPYEPNPVDAAFEYADDILFDEQRLKGEQYQHKITFSTGHEIMDTLDFIGYDPQNVYIEQGKMLHGEYVLVTPEGRLYRLDVTWPSGKQWDADTERAYLSSALKKKYPSVEKPSGEVASAAIQANYYVRYFWGV